MDNNWLEEFSMHQQLGKVISLNDITMRYGISITEEDALVLMDDRKYSLKDKQRVEFGEGILPKLINAFCDSEYIYKDNFLETIGRLQDVFYEYKNESMDEINDDELIDFMRDAFNGECEGSVDYLEETILEEFARRIRVSDQNYLQHYYRKRAVEDD